MKKSRKWLWFLIFLIVVGGGGAAAWRFRPEELAAVQLGAIETVERLDLIVTATGEIRAKEFVDIQAEIAGVIVELPVTEGQQVKKGDVLLKIDPFQARQDMESARAQYDAAIADAGGAEVQIAMGQAGLKQEEFVLKASESEVTREKANLERLRKKYEREKKLLADGILSPDDFEATELSFTIAKDALAISEARVEQAHARINASQVSIDQQKKQHQAALRRADGAKANLDRMDDMFKKTTLFSPLDGVITKLEVEKGERAVPGIMSNPQATLMTIADLSVLEAEIRVDETDIINVALNKKATVVCDALQEVEIEGFVSEIGNSPIASAGQMAGAASNNQEGRDFKVVIRLVNPPPQLRPGMTAGADLYADHRDHCIVAPLQAITVREVVVDAQGNYTPPTLAEIVAAEAKRKAGDKLPADDPALLKEELEGVFVREGDRVRFRPIRLGIKGETEVEVVAGLKTGEEIVIGPYKVLRTLKDGDRVKIDEKAVEAARARAKTPNRRSKKT